MYKWKNKTISNNKYEKRITKQPSLLYVLYGYHRNNNEDNTLYSWMYNVRIII